MNIQIAVLLTCFNRREKTVACLGQFYRVLDEYNDAHGDRRISAAVFLTDDGCTDGTAQAVRDISANRELHIISGNGSLYWAGGMREAWREALRDSRPWDFFLLLNDDTVVLDNVFDELLNAHAYCLQTYGKAGICSGITCDANDPLRVTYSGDVFASSARARFRRLGPSGKPQLVDQTNANILLVAAEVVRTVGIFYEGYRHGAADMDYCMMVRRAGYPAVITAKVCGKCDYDHPSEEEEILRLMKMSFAERRRYVSLPTHSDREYLLFVRRNIPSKFLVSWTLRNIRLFLPSLYYRITKARGIYNK